MTDWKADPKRGKEQVEPRRAEVVKMLEQAADVASFAIDEQLDADIQRLKQDAAGKKAKIAKQVSFARTAPAMQVVRKYWNEDQNAMWKHFVYNMAEKS